MLYWAAGWCPQQTPDIWQAGCFVLVSCFSNVFPNVFPIICLQKFPLLFSYGFFPPMLYRAAGGCPQQTPDIWQAGCFFWFHVFSIVFPMFSNHFYPKISPGVFLLFFPNVVTGSWLVSSADPRYMASWPAPLGQGINIPFESIPHHLESIYIHVMKTKTRSNSETFPIMRSKGPVKFQFKVKITMHYFTSAKSVERCQTMFW